MVMDGWSWMGGHGWMVEEEKRKEKRIGEKRR
jgi:hypothetical protein